MYDVYEVSFDGKVDRFTFCGSFETRREATARSHEIRSKFGNDKQTRRAGIWANNGRIVQQVNTIRCVN